MSQVADQSTSPPPVADAAPPRSRQSTALLIVGLAALLASLNQSLLIPVLSQITEAAHTTSDNAAWLLTSTLLVAAVSVPTFGRLGDLYGKRLMFVVALIALVVGSLVCALAGDSLPVLIAGRAIVGLSSATIPLGISLVSTLLPPERAGSGIALISAMLGIGGSLGLPLSGLIAEHSDYHVLFWICAVGGVLTLVGVWLALPESPKTGSGKMDIGGALLLGVAILALLLPLAEGESWGWTDVKTVGLLVAAVILLVVFVLVERRRKSPLVDIKTSARPAVLLTNIASLCVGFALFATLIGTASYVQAPAATGYGFGSSIVVSGLCLLPSGLAMLILSPVSAKLSERFGPKITLALGAAVVALGFLGRMVFTGHLWEIIVWTTIAGAGTGIAYAAMPSLIVRAVPRSELAAANGLNTLFRSVGSSLSSAIGGAILASSTIALGTFALPSLTAYRILFALCAGAAIIGAAVALTIPTNRSIAGDH
jgi:MFS family permease